MRGNGKLLGYFLSIFHRSNWNVGVGNQMMWMWCCDGRNNVTERKKSNNATHLVHRIIELYAFSYITTLWMCNCVKCFSFYSYLSFILLHILFTLRFHVSSFPCLLKKNEIYPVNFLLFLCLLRMKSRLIWMIHSFISYI